MNAFCRCLRESISRKFRLEAEVFVSKQKKIVHIGFSQPLIAYSFSD